MADALIAFRDGDQGDDGRTGAMLIAEGLSNLRGVVDFLSAYAKARSRKA
jgi:hypothetical protein